VAARGARAGVTRRSIVVRIRDVIGVFGGWRAKIQNRSSLRITLSTT